jgi:hypothetical protein
MIMKVFVLRVCLVLLILGYSGPARGAGPEVRFAGPSGEVDVYDFVEITIQVENPDIDNPFTEVSVQGTFSLEGHDRVKVDGFCDCPDGGLYRIRFMPSRAGRYDYVVTYRQKDLRVSHKGSFAARGGGRPGPLRLDPDNRRHFIWEGTGEHYFWNGTTTYYLMGWDDETIRSCIDRLAGLKINRLRVLLYGRNNRRPWRQPVVPTEKFKLHLNPWPAKRPDNIRNPGFDLTRFNVEHWRKYERLLRYARERNMIVSVIFFIGGQVLPTPFEAGSAEEDLYYRYGIARFGAFSNVTWDLGNEHNFHRKVPDWADTLGHKVKEWDPYDHLASAHNVTYRTPRSTWLDMQLIQRWDSGQNAYMLRQCQAQQERGYIIPQINEEYGYEDLWEKYPGQRSAETRRKNAWEIYMAGCYQTTGESARRGTGISPDTGGGWVNGRGDGTMTMLEGYGHIVDFFTSLDWWNYKASNDMVEGAACCLAKVGKSYILYFREGGRATIRLTDDYYHGRWYNPRQGRFVQSVQASGPAWTTPETPDKADWVLWLEKDHSIEDKEEPEIVSVVTDGTGHKVMIEFNEMLDHVTAKDPANYRIEPGVRISGVSLGGTYGKTAILSVSALREKQRYRVLLSSVTDRAGNEIETSKSFEYISPRRALIELKFNENQGLVTANSGSSQIIAGQARLTSKGPGWSANTPPGGGTSSLWFGNEPGEYAVDLPTESAGAIKGLKSFTITAWVNCTSNEEGPGGNRIVHAADTLGSRDGIDLVFVRDGRLKLGVNEWPDSTEGVSSPGLIPVDKNAAEDNWRFLAVTYDCTADEDHLKIYIGSPTKEVYLDKAISYDRGAVGKGVGPVTIGHFNRKSRSNNGDRMFRGLIDEVRIFGSKTDGTGALSVRQIRAVQKSAGSLVE